MNSESALCNHEEYSTANIIISGGFSPFVGSGVSLDSWSFTVDLSEPGEISKPIGSIDVNELYIKIEKNLKKFDANIIIKDGLFIDGRDVNFLEYLLPNGRLNKPIDKVDNSYIFSKINKNDKKERHYKLVQIPIWDGQLFLSIYYRMMIVNDGLFVETRFFLLPPLKKKYLDIANLPTLPTQYELGKHIASSIFAGVFSWIVVYVKLLIYIQNGFETKKSRIRKWEREVKSNRLYNYGWDESLREKWSELIYERYFQSVDKDFALKTITNELLTTLRRYLFEKNVATDQFKQATTTIFNEGIIISGGNVKTDSLAVGKGANISKNVLNKTKGD